MNIIMLLKTIFVTAVLLLLVLIGLYNNAPIDFKLPPLTAEVKQPAALMYFAFFGVGLLTGAVLSIGMRKASRQA